MYKNIYLLLKIIIVGFYRSRIAETVVFDRSLQRCMWGCQNVIL